MNNNNQVLNEFFVWEEKNSTDLNQNLLKNAKPDKCVTTIETKTNAENLHWKDITDPKLRKKMQKYDWYIKNKNKLKDKKDGRIEIICENCSKIFYDKPSSYNRKKRHFCSKKCYGEFRKFIPVNEQSAYKGVRKDGESKYIYHKRYAKSHPELIAHLKARRYARKKNADGSHSLQEWEDLIIKFNNKCAFCEQTKKLTKDHIIPLSKGGSDFITNIQPLCKNCNSKKYNKILP
jgi:hypothetical protein